MFTLCCYNVGPPSATVAQHFNNIGLTLCVCWVNNIIIIIASLPIKPVAVQVQWNLIILEHTNPEAFQIFLVENAHTFMYKSRLR